MIYLIGASGHAKVVIDSLEKLNLLVGGLKDDNPKTQSLLGYNVYSELPSNFNSEFDRLLITIGNNSVRKRISEEYNYKYYTVINPYANISDRVQIGEGSVIMAGATVNADVVIGNHVIVNTNCSIDHDCIVHHYAHVSPNAALAGGVTIGEGTHVGIGACVIQGVKIGKWCTIGAGSVVLRDIPDGAKVVGNPGRLI